MGKTTRITIEFQGSCLLELSSDMVSSFDDLVTLVRDNLDVDEQSQALDFRYTDD